MRPPLWLVLVGGARGLSVVRLDRYLVQTGSAGSRTASAALVKSGRVQVDGKVVRSGKAKVFDASVVEVDGDVVSAFVPLLCAYHKPLDVHSTTRDHRGRADLSTALAEAPPTWRRALHPVGRLDADTTGLLLWSSKGDLTHRLLHPRRRVEKEYVAHCDVPASDRGAFLATLRDRLASGVATATGVHAADLLDAAEANDLVQVRLVVTEGKHRMVRRILANLGAPVVHLRRDRVGPVRLGDLAEGHFLPLDDPALLRWATDLLDDRVSE
mmetsp:Transcript_21465/g.69091  ORF Transcript_21465/g.69091 Transcript_21465/m.69091 type:complete len:270 (-) Transcript_21465:8-817(-)